MVLAHLEDVRVGEDGAVAVRVVGASAAGLVEVVLVLVQEGGRVRPVRARVLVVRHVRVLVEHLQPGDSRGCNRVAEAVTA